MYLYRLADVDGWVGLTRLKKKGSELRLEMSLRLHIPTLQDQKSLNKCHTSHKSSNSAK